MSTTAIAPDERDVRAVARKLMMTWVRFTSETLALLEYTSDWRRWLHSNLEAHIAELQKIADDLKETSARRSKWARE